MSSVENLLLRYAGSDILDDEVNPDSSPAEAGFSEADIGIDRDSLPEVVAHLRRSTRPGLDSIKCFGQDLFCYFGVVRSLGAQPIAIGQAKESAQAKIRIGGDGTLARHNLADALRGNADLLGKPILRDRHWDEKLLTQ